MLQVCWLQMVASAAFPMKHVDVNFDTSENELFVQVRYDIKDKMNLAGRENLVNQVEQALEPHRDALMAKAKSFTAKECTNLPIELRLH